MRLLLLLLTTASTPLLQAQKINGFVKNEGAAPLNGATVTLIKTKDSSTNKLVVTNANGSYTFSGMKDGNYRVMITHVGYKPAFAPGFSFNSSDANVAKLTFSKIPANLTMVNVIASKPMVDVKADKTIVNVENTINGVGSK